MVFWRSSLISYSTVMIALVFYVGLDVEYGSAVRHVQPPDTNGRVFDLQHFQDRHTDGVGPDGRAGAKDAHLFTAVRGRLPEEPRREIGASMKVEDHDDALAWFDVFEPFQISLIDNQRSFHTRNAPVTWNLLDVRVHEADRLQLDTCISCANVFWFLHH